MNLTLHVFFVAGYEICPHLSAQKPGCQPVIYQDFACYPNDSNIFQISDDILGKNSDINVENQHRCGKPSVSLGNDA
jgi:hypothetical protein